MAIVFTVNQRCPRVSDLESESSLESFDLESESSLESLRSTGGRVRVESQVFGGRVRVESEVFDLESESSLKSLFSPQVYLYKGKKLSGHINKAALLLPCHAGCVQSTREEVEIGHVIH